MMAMLVVVGLMMYLDMYAVFPLAFLIIGMPPLTVAFTSEKFDLLMTKPLSEEFLNSFFSLTYYR